MGCQEKIRIRPPPCGTPPPAIVRQPPRRAPIKIRVAVNSGEVVVHSIRLGEAHTEYAPIEHTTNVAARLQAIARTSSIVVSENTCNLTEAYFPVTSLGCMRVKGIPEAVNVHEVSGLESLRTRLKRAVGGGLTRFVRNWKGASRRLTVSTGVRYPKARRPKAHGTKSKTCPIA